MTTPSTQELSKVFSNPKAAEKILQMNYDELIQTETGKARLKACRSVSPINRPKDYDLILEELNASEPKFYGVEPIELPDGDFAMHLNVGGTYDLTLIYCDNEFRVQSMGDFIEEYESNHPESRDKPE